MTFSEHPAAPLKPVETRRKLLPWALILLLSHLVTAIIQWRPMFFQAMIQIQVHSTFGNENGFIAGLGFILLVLGWNTFGQAEHRLDISAKFAILAGSLGRIPAVFLFISMMLPQRILDLATGYTPIEAGSAVAWVLLFLDILRGFAVFQIFLWLLEEPSHTEPHIGERPQSVFQELRLRAAFFTCTTRRFILFLAVFFSIATQVGVLENIPHVQDEIIQDWHARTFASGQNHAPPVPCRESFIVWGIGDTGDRLYSSFQPGYPLLLSLWMRILQAFPIIPTPMGGAFGVCLLNPLLFLMTCLLLYALLIKTHDKPIAQIAGVLLAISPFALIMISGRMNHPASLLLFIAGAWGITLLEERHLVKAALIVGLSCGFMLMTRRLDGAILAIAVLITVLTSGRRIPTTGCIPRKSHGWRVVSGCDPGLLLFTFLTACGVSLVFGIQASLNSAQSGDALQMIRQAERVSSSWSQIPIETYLQNLIDQLLGFNVYAFGGIVSGFMGIGFLSWRKPGSAGWLERFFSFHALLTIMAYGLYDYQDFCYGPRFYFNLLPGACLGAALVLNHLATAVSYPRFRRWIIVGGSFALLVLCQHVWAVFGHHYWHIDRQFEQVLHREIQQPSLVFLESSSRMRLEAARILTRLGIHAERVEEIISTDALDFLGLADALQGISASSDTRKLSSLSEPVIEYFLRQARFSSPIEHEINEHETVRLNSPAIFDSPLVIALDLGDRPNQSLIDKLPRHTSLLAFRKGTQIFLKPYTACGIDGFR